MDAGAGTSLTKLDMGTEAAPYYQLASGQRYCQLDPNPTHFIPLHSLADPSYGRPQALDKCPNGL